MKTLHLMVVILCVVVQLNVISGNKGKYHNQALNADKAELGYGRDGHVMKRGATKRTKKLSITQRPIGWDTSSNNQQRPAAPPAYSPQQPAPPVYSPQQPAPPVYSPQHPAPPPYSPQYSPQQNPSYVQNPMQQPPPQVVNNYHPAPAQTGGSSGPGILGSVLIGGAAGLGGAALYDAFKPDDKVEEQTTSPVVAVPVKPDDKVEEKTTAPVVAVEGIPLSLAAPETTLLTSDSTSTTDSLSSDNPTIITDATKIVTTVDEVIEPKNATSNDAEKQTIDCAAFGTTTKYSLNVTLFSIIISIFY